MAIRDCGDFRSLYFGAEHLQSRMSLSKPEELTLAYTRYMAFPLLTQSIFQNILVIGIGAGSFVRFFHHHFPDCYIDAIDYSSHVIKAAKGYFKLPEGKRVSIKCADGYEYLKNSYDKKYDLILVDAFDDKGMAETVYSDAFFRLCSTHLSPKGAVSCNLWSNDKLRLAEIKTFLADNFPAQIYLPVPDRGNVVAIATFAKVPWKNIFIKDKDLHLLSKRYGINFRRLVKIAKQANFSITSQIKRFFHS